MITLPARSQTAYRLEVLPLSVDAGAVLLLRPPSGWTPPDLTGGHPEEAVSAALAAAGFSLAVVHSTSWRFEAGTLVVTYVAVLTGGVKPPGWTPVEVRRAELAWGTPTSAPERVESEQVLEHALRHLAWLASSNRSIAAALPSGWHAALAAYTLPVRVDSGGGPVQDCAQHDDRREAREAVGSGRRA